MSENSMEQELKQIQKSKSKIGITIAIIIAVFLVILISMIAAFSYLNIQNTNIVPGVYIKGISVSGLSKQEAKKKVEEELNKKMIQTINLSYGEYKTELTISQLEARFDINDAILKAYHIGREGNFLQNDFTVLKTMISNVNVEPRVILNEEELIKQLQTISSQLPDTVIESSFYIEGENLIVTKGKVGSAIDIKLMRQNILKQIASMEKTEEMLLQILVNTKVPNEIDVAKIYSQIRKDPVNAYYTTDPFVVHPHEDGIDFAISIEEAQAIVKNEGEEFTIPLKITRPEVTTNMIGTEAFPDLLASFSTKYNASNKPRTTNLKLAAGKINGVVLMPGEVFSYNTVVGKRTIAAGYKEAAIYQNGQVTDGLGGGICQISTTLYNAVVYANLGIVERRNHMFIPSYVGASRDATVVYGSTDFKFKNNRKYPIKVVCSVSGGIVNFKIFGLKQENEYEVEIQTKITGSIPYSTTYKENTGKKTGTVIQKGAKGTKSEAYRVLKKDGKVVKTELLSKDTYRPMNKIIAK